MNSKNLTELDFQLEFETWKLFKIFNLDANIFEIWDFWSMLGLEIIISVLDLNFSDIWTWL